MKTRVYEGTEAMLLSMDGVLEKATSPEDLCLIQVYGDDGRVIGKMFLAKFLHVEGAWIDPEFRGNVGVVGSLLRELVECAHRKDRGVVIAGAADEHMRSILYKMGATHLPLQFYALRVGG